MTSEEITVRPATAADAKYAEAASALIAEAARTHDIAEREVAFLIEKIESGKAAVALRSRPGQPDELIGFGYFSAWQDGAFVSHSGLVVRPDLRGHKLGRRLKTALFEGSRAKYPNATTMSLTTSPQVKAMNLSLGFEVVPFEEMTTDEAFWDGCKTCRNYAEMQAKGIRCCCEAMILRP